MKPPPLPEAVPHNPNLLCACTACADAFIVALAVLGRNVCPGPHVGGRVGICPDSTALMGDCARWTVRSATTMSLICFF